MGLKRAAVRLLPGLVLVLTGKVACAAVDTPVTDPWRATGLDFSFIEQRVQTDACYRSETRFLSCMSALQRLLERDPRQVRMVISDTERAAAPSATQAQFGALVLVKATPARNDHYRSVVAEVRARAARIADWRHHYRSRSEAAIDFSALREWLLSGIEDHEYRSAFAAAAINGYLSIADAHAKIMPAELLNADKGGSGSGAAGRPGGGRYSGVGIGLELIGNMPIITRVVPGGPAEQAGLQQHDRLVSVDGTPFAGGSLEATLNRVRGPEGTTVTLQYQRGRKLHSVQVMREEIALENVVSSVLRDGESDWGYLRVHSFMTQDTCRNVGGALDELIEAGVNGLILDVRNNAGGRIDQAVCVADLFLDANLVVLEMRSTREKRRPQTLRTRFKMRTRLPLVTLVNAGTGSAAEVLAGALRDYGRNLLIGERTFGKGTIQITQPWDDAGAIMKFSTTARYYLPSGSSVQRVGIEPDFHVSRQAPGDAGQRQVLRLADFYPTTLPSGSSEQVNRTAPEQLSLACLAGAEQPRRSGDRAPAGLADYPLYRASELLGCML